MFMTTMMGIAQPVLPLYLQDTVESFAAIGTIVSAMSIGQFMGAIPSSGVLSRLSMRAGMLLGCAIIICSLLGMYQSQTSVGIFASWMCVGIGYSLYELARYQYIAFYIDNQFRGRAVSVIGGISRLGSVIGAALGGWVAYSYGFNTPFLWMAGCALMAGGIIFVYVPNVRPSVLRSKIGMSSRTSSAPSYGGEFGQMLREQWRLLAVAGSAQMLMQLVRKSRSILIPLFASNVLGMNVASVGLVMSVGSSFDTAMFLPAGFVMDKLGRKAAIVPSLIMQATGFILLPFTVGFWSLVGVASLIGFANGLSSGAMTTLGADLSPTGQRIQFLAVWRMFSALGFILGPNAVGVVAQLFALAPASTTIGIIGFSAATLFWRFVPETLRRKERLEKL
ncbi:MAG: MFS transporter [Ardenticatenaceae bacterium]